MQPGQSIAFQRGFGASQRAFVTLLVHVIANDKTRLILWAMHGIPAAACACFALYSRQISRAACTPQSAFELLQKAVENGKRLGMTRRHPELPLAFERQADARRHQRDRIGRDSRRYFPPRDGFA